MLENNLIEEFDEQAEMKKLADDISEEITGKAVDDQSKLSMEDFIEYRMRQKVIELLEVDKPLRKKWKEFLKFESSFIGELRSVPRSYVRNISLKKFISYYNDVKKLQEDISKEISSSYEGGTDEDITARD